ncbi:hypothetical protein YIM_32425 [Amycolatopsis sp. YIM 10]|nr:hypothetical protein YIM_32425 [Amycolatopsis sp. YIM 10]
MSTESPVPRARTLRALAEQGGFAVDEQTGDRLIEALDAVVRMLEQRWERLRSIEREPQLGTSPAARYVAARMAETANDEQGLLTRLQRARTEFPAYVEAIELAKRNYGERELTTRDVLGAPDGELENDR